MPLDQIARQYATELFNAKQEQILEEQRKKRAALSADHAKGSMLPSGPYLAAEGKLQAETVMLMTEALAETLVSAFEKSGVQFDDTVLHEITNEMSAFCATQQRHAIAYLSHLVTQEFGSSPEPGVLLSATGQVEVVANSVMAKIARNLRIRRYEVILDDRKAQKVYAAALGKQWDVFISHASEDKQEFVRPLADALTKSGLKVWYDENTLKVGDSLRRAIDHGLTNSRFGIVVLSHSFFSKPWPQQELDGLFTREIEGVKVILPVWHNIAAPEVRQYSPMLAGRLAVNSSAGLDVVVRQLREAMGLES